MNRLNRIFERLQTRSNACLHSTNAKPVDQRHWNAIITKRQSLQTTDKKQTTEKQQ